MRQVLEMKMVFKRRLHIRTNIRNSLRHSERVLLSQYAVSIPNVLNMACSLVKSRAAVSRTIRGGVPVKLMRIP